MDLNKKMITEIAVENKIVFLRLDLNVPIIDKKITSTKRIDAVLPTIKYLLDNNAKIVILSHLGRPSSLEDLKDERFSLKLVAQTLAKKLGNLTPRLTFVSSSKGSKVEDMIFNLKSKEILVLENTRFNDIDKETGEIVNYESGNNYDLAKYWASLCDVFINDAYGAAHRKHASTYGIAEFQKNNAIGFLMFKEISELNSIINEPIRPLTVIFGGAKVSDKILAVESVLKKADNVIISGGMAYTFLAAQKYDVGISKYEADFIPMALDLMSKYKDKIIISSDFLCAPKFQDLKPIYKTKEDGLSGLMGLDIGQKSIKDFGDVISKSNSILWNGPMGVTEFNNFTIGTNKICEFISERTKLGAFTIIGGGDSAAAAEKLKKEDGFSWISTGGGASLVLLSGKELIALEPISNSTKPKNKKKINKIILDNKYVAEYISQNRINNQREVKDINYFNELVKNNPLIKHNLNKKIEKSNASIKEILAKDKINSKYNINSEDPLVIYNQRKMIIRTTSENLQNNNEIFKLSQQLKQQEQIIKQKNEQISILNSKEKIRTVENPINIEQENIIKNQKKKIYSQEQEIQMLNERLRVKDDTNKKEAERLAKEALELQQQRKMLESLVKELETKIDLADKETQRKLEEQSRKLQEANRLEAERLAKEAERLKEQQRLEKERLAIESKKLEEQKKIEQEKLAQEAKKLEEEKRLVEQNLKISEIANKAEQDRLAHKAKKLEEREKLAEATKKALETANKLEQERLAKEAERIKKDKKEAEEVVRKAEKVKKEAEEAQLKLNLKSKMIKKISEEELEKRQKQTFTVDNNVSANDKSAKTIMISLDKEYIEKIISDEKEIIFFKRLPVQKVERVLIYSVKPIGKVVGEFDLKSTNVMTKTKSWKELGNRSIFRKKDFDEYFKDQDDVKIMELDGFIPYSKPRPLSDFKLTRGPSGFCYLK